jgi:uncharacterized damage-inducible protein DinB
MENPMTLSRKMQELVDAMATHREALLASVSGLDQAQLNYRPGDDQWSIADILNHLALADEANLKLTLRAAKKAGSGILPPDNSPDESKLHSLDAFSSAAKQKAQAPEFVVPREHLPADESIAKLTSSRAQLVDTIPSIVGHDLTAISYPHPLLGPLDFYQWLLIAGLHEARHRKQIDRIKADPSFPS